ncbi:MAG: hypothetical protein AAGJ84_12395 [Pseudomonadota bacterium]
MITENWDHFRYFVELVQAGSLSGASRTTETDGQTVGWVPQRLGFAVPAALEKRARVDSLRLSTSSLYTQAVAARHGIGAAVLPCFIGDKEPALKRDGGILADLQQDLWLVYHAALGAVPGVRVTLEFISDLVASKRHLLVGREPA